MISQTPFIIVDLETTGLEPKLDRIIEMAAVKVVNGEVVDEWEKLINPGIFIPQETTHITGITSEMVKTAPKFDEVVDDFLSFMNDDAVFVAHNVEFDRGFVNSHLKKHDREELPHPYLCTFRLAKQVHPNLNSYSLGALTGYFEIELPQAHRALHDARATAELFNKFMKTLQDGGAKQLSDISAIQNLPSAPKEEAGEGQISLF